MTNATITRAVAELTTPVIHTHQIPHVGKDGSIAFRQHNTWLPSLLDQLEQAVTSTMGGQGNSASLKNTRQVIDSEALHLFLRIKSQITDWCRMVGIRAGKDAAENLMLWSDAIEVEDGTFYARMMRDWAKLIRAKLDPPKRREILHPCVVCNATVWVDEDGDTRPHPLEVSYRPGEGEIRVLCRACKNVWEGADAAKELGEEIAEIG